MTTAFDIIKSAMRKAGIITKTESPSSDEIMDGLESLNSMLDSWANDALNVPARTLESFNLVGGQANYTIGVGGDFNTIRPITIIAAYTREGTIDDNLSIVSDENYAELTQKSSQGTPRLVNYTNAHPLSTIRLYPTPDSSYQLFILSEKQLGNYSLFDTVNLPSGWIRAIVYQLAVEIAPEYGQPVSNEVAAIALESMSKIRSAVARNRSLDVPFNGDDYDIYTGWTN